MGARGPIAKPKPELGIGKNQVSRTGPRGPRKQRRRGPPQPKEMDKGAVLPAMLYPPVPLDEEASAWYGRLMRRRAHDDPEPMLPTHRLRREDSLLVANLAKMLAELDRKFNRMLAKDTNDLMMKLGCSPSVRDRLGDAPKSADEDKGEFDEYAVKH